MNPIAGWLFIIGTPDRARKLRMLLDRLQLGHVDIVDDPLRPGETMAEYTPPMCPSQALFGQREAAKLYASPWTRPALDAWDQQFVSKEDLRRLCFDIERGRYSGPVFVPAVGQSAVIVA